MTRIGTLLALSSLWLGAGIARADDQPLSAQEVRKTVEAHLGAIKGCISKEAPSGPTGKIVVHYFILPSGKVDKPGVQESTTTNAKLDRCIVDVFRGLQFAQPRGGATMEQLYPLQFTAPKPVGDLAPPLVAAAINPHLGEVKACFLPGVTEAKPAIKGKLIVHFTVATSGAVTAAKVVKSETAFPAGDQCVIAALKKWTFPKPTGGAEAVIPDYPFVINLEGKAH